MFETKDAWICFGHLNEWKDMLLQQILLHTPFVDNLFNCWRLFIDYQSFKEMGGRNVEMMKQILISELNFVVKMFILDLSGNRRNFNFLVLSILN